MALSCHIRLPQHRPRCVFTTSCNPRTRIVRVLARIAITAPTALSDGTRFAMAATPIEGRINWGSCDSGGTAFFPAVTTLKPGAYINFFG